MKTFIQGQATGLKFKQAQKIQKPIDFVQLNEEFEIKNTERTYRGKAGDYLIIDTDGMLYPVAQEDFANSYKEVKG